MLPNVYENPINKKINNVQNLYRCKNTNNTIDINKKINEIFASKNHVYKSSVRITLKDSILDTQIVSKTNTYLLTLDGKLIKISDILDLERV